MRGPAVFLLAWAVWFVVLLMFFVWTTANGYITARMLELSGTAVLTAEGRASINDALTAYPALPYLMTSAVRVLVKGGIPALVSAAIAGGFAAATIGAVLRRSGYRRATALLITAAFVANPVFLFGLSEGPGIVLLLLGLLLLYHGFFALREEGDAPQVMAVSFALVIIGFAHPYGMVLCLAALPFLVLAVPPPIMARSPAGLMMSLLFPLAFGVLSFAYINWLFIQEAWAFIGPAQASFGTAGVADEGLFRCIVSTTLALAATGPVALVGLMMIRSEPDRLWPGIAATGLAVSAAALGLAFGYSTHPGLVLMPALALAVTVAARWPRSPKRGPAVFALAMLGMVGGALVIFLSDRADATNWRRAALGAAADGVSYAAEKDLAVFLAPRSDVLLDAKGNLGLIGWMGSAEGLVVPGDITFENALFTRRPGTRFVAVRERTEDPARTDRVMGAFDELYARGMPDYQIVYDKEGWRVFERDD